MGVSDTRRRYRLRTIRQEPPQGKWPRGSVVHGTSRYNPGRRNAIHILKILTALLLVAIAITSTLAWQRNERDYALSEAVTRNDTARVRKLLDAGADPNALWSGYDLKATAYRLVGCDPFDGGPLRDDYRIVRHTLTSQIRQLLIEHGARP